MAEELDVDTEVIIPTWNRCHSLIRTLDSLRAGTLVPAICVVDNGSEDGTPAVLAANYPEVRVVRLDRNLGFGAAINRGLRDSTAPLVILLNNDTVADRAFVERMVDAHRSTGAEMVAGCLRFRDGRVDSAGIQVDQSLIAHDLLHGEPYGADSWHRSAQPLGPTGGAAGYARTALEASGGFDEALFAYLEDVDLALRLRLAGASCSLAYDAFAWHEHSGTLGSGSSAKNRLMGRSRSELVWKHGAGIPLSSRVRGHLIDATVYLGQLVVDRNLGAVHGRAAGWRAHRGVPRPPARDGLGELIEPVSLRKALRRRLARRGIRSDPATASETAS